LTITVDLLTQQVRCSTGDVESFEIDPHERETLISGLDAIDRTWLLRGAIEAFEVADRARRPWVWAPHSR
jgi:3-isopropylmalate/(R)-2-methylmalate dehydratase small subunit